MESVPMLWLWHPLRSAIVLALTGSHAGKGTGSGSMPVQFVSLLQPSQDVGLGGLLVSGRR